MSSVVTVHGTGLSGPSVTATLQMANNISFVMAKENFLNDNVTVGEARDSENILVISGSRTAVTDQIESWNGKGLVDGFDISGGGGGGGATVKNASVGVHEGNIPQDRDYRIVVSGEIKEVPDNGTRIGPSTVSGVSRAPGLRSIFTYTGEITSFEADRKVSIKQDGEIIREGTQEPPPAPDPPPNEQPPGPNPEPGQPGDPGFDEQLRVGTFGPNSIQSGSERYLITVSGEALISQGDDNRTIEDGSTVVGEISAPGGSHKINYSGEIVNVQTGPNLSLERNSAGGSNDSGSNDEGGGNQAGLLGGTSTSTIALIGAAGIGAYLIGQNS